jgi:hypothetical protein
MLGVRALSPARRPTAGPPARRPAAGPPAIAAPAPAARPRGRPADECGSGAVRCDPSSHSRLLGGNAGAGGRVVGRVKVLRWVRGVTCAAAEAAGDRAGSGAGVWHDLGSCALQNQGRRALTVVGLARERQRIVVPHSQGLGCHAPASSPSTSHAATATARPPRRPACWTRPRSSSVSKKLAVLGDTADWQARIQHTR